MNLEEIIKVLKLYKNNPSIMNDDNYTETIVNTFESMLNFSNEFEDEFKKITEQIGEDIIDKFVEDFARGSLTKFDYICNNKKELFNYILDEFGLSFFFPELTPKILDRYGEIIIYCCESESTISLPDPNLIEFLINQGRYDLLKKVNFSSFHELRPETRKKLLENLDQEKINEIISQSYDLLAIFPHFTREILKKYGPAIIKNMETHFLVCKDENLINYLFEQERIDLINKQFPILTEEIFKKYGSLIMNYIENNSIIYFWKTDEYLLKYLKDNNRLDLIAKMNLEYIFSKLTKEILNEYGPAIIKYLENKADSPWRDKCLLEYLEDNNRFDLIAKMDLEYILPELTKKKLIKYLRDNNRFDLIAKMDLKNIFPRLTEGILIEYGPAIIKYLERVYYSSWYDKCLLEYLEDNNRFDLIAKMDLEYIFPRLTEEILNEYGPAIIKYLERNVSSRWNDNCLLKYLKNNNRFDLIAKMELIIIFPELTEEILNEYGPAIIKYLEKNVSSRWNDNCLLKYLKNNNRFDLIAKMDLGHTFPELTEENFDEYGPVIIKYLERVESTPWSNEHLLKYLIKHDRFDLTRKLSLNFENVENIFPELEYSLKITMENLRYKLSYLYNRNDEIFSTLNFKILKLKIQEDILLIITLYPDIQEKIINLDNVVSSKFFEIIEKVKSKKYDTVQVIESILNNVLNYKDLLNNLDVNSLNENELNNLIYVLQHENNIFNILNIEDLKEENFKRKKDIYFENVAINIDNLDEISLKEAIVESMYGISLYQACFIIRRYSYDFDDLRNDGLDENVITIIENLDKIVNETDISKLRVIYQSRNDIPGLETDFMSSLSLEASIRSEYAKMYNEVLYKINENDLSKNPKLNNVTYQDKKIEIYEPSNEFHMQIHALGAYSSFSRPDNFKDDWLRPKIAYHGICTSYIANNEIATARQYHPILGFSNYEEKALLLVGNHDLGSNKANISFATSGSNPHNFLPPKTIIDTTRHNHNEMVIERIKKDSNNMCKRTPNYIVYIIDDINNDNNFVENNELYQETLQAAYDFDIPIVVVDRLKYAKQEKERCDSLEREFNDSRNPETLRELFLNYMNNWVGCRKFDGNPEAEYNDIFNDKVVHEFYKRITDLIKNDIHEMKDINKTNEEILMMIKLLQYEKKSRVLSTLDGKREPFSIDDAISKYQELLKEFKSKLTALKQNEVTQDVALEETVSKTR